MTEHYPFINTPLPYGYDALEPYIDQQTMHLHHDRHLQTYIDNLNAALKKCPDLQEMSLEELICTSGKLPADIGVPVLRNAGGVYNHRFYFDGMSTPSGSRPFGILAGAVNQSFTNFDRFKETLSAAALSIFGSGYAWLASDRAGFGSSPLQTRKRRCPAGSAQFSTLMSGNTLIT